MKLSSLLLLDHQAAVGMSFFCDFLALAFLRFSLKSYGTVSCISVITIFKIRTMSGLADVARMEAESVEGFF